MNRVAMFHPQYYPTVVRRSTRIFEKKKKQINPETNKIIEEIYKTFSSKCWCQKNNVYISKQDFLEKIKSITSFEGVFENYPQLLEKIISVGDPDYLVTFLNVKGFGVYFERDDDFIDYAIYQEQPIMAIYVLLAAIQCDYNAYKLNGYALNTERYRMIRQKTKNINKMFEISLRYARHSFYMILYDQLQACLAKINPLSENYNEDVLREVTQLSDEFYHDSSIGPPDNSTPAYEIAGLTSEKEIKEFILDWCETNPLAAMRCFYVYYTTE